MDKAFMARAIELSVANVRSGSGGPFGTVIVRDGAVVAEAANRVTASNDPTAHAEVLAIRQACQKLGFFELKGCDLYTSCEPCPMCLGAIYWARIERVYFGGLAGDAAKAGLTIPPSTERSRSLTRNAKFHDSDDARRSSGSVSGLGGKPWQDSVLSSCFGKLR